MNNSLEIPKKDANLFGYKKINSKLSFDIRKLQTYQSEKQMKKLSNSFEL